LNADTNASLLAELQQQRDHLHRLSVENCQLHEQLLQAHEAQIHSEAQLAALKQGLENAEKELNQARLADHASVQDLEAQQSHKEKLKLKHSLAPALFEQPGQIKKQIDAQRELERQYKQSAAGNPALTLPFFRASSDQPSEPSLSPSVSEIAPLYDQPFSSSHSASDVLGSAIMVSASVVPLPLSLVSEAPSGAPLQVSKCARHRL
jgi:hypothetical protein